MTTGPYRHGYDWKPRPYPRGELPLAISIALVTTSNEQSDDLSGGTAPSLPASRGGAAAAAVRGSSLASAILEHCRKVLPVRVTFIRLMRHNVPIESVVEQCCVTHKTVFEWRHRVLATVTGYQGRIVLRDTAWVNETYIIDTDLSRATGRRVSAAYPARSCAFASPSTSTRTPSRSSAAAGSPARRA